MEGVAARLATDPGLLQTAFGHLIVAIAQIRLGDPHAARKALALADACLERQERCDPPAERLARLRLTAEGVVRWLERDLDGAKTRFDDALADPDGMSRYDQFLVRFWRATVHMGRGTPAEAFHDLLWAYEDLRHADRGLFGLISLNLGAVLVHAGDWVGAEACFREALACEGEIALRGFAVVARSNLAYCLIHTAQTAAARVLMDEALRLDRAYLLRRHPGDVFTTIAENLIETGLYEEAERYVADMLDENERRRYGLGIATALWCRGRLAWLRGDALAAQHDWCRATLALRRAPHLTHRWKVMRGLAELCAAHEDWRRAWRWERRFHGAFLDWEAQSRSVRLAYARETLELHATRAERDAAEAERARLEQALCALEAANEELADRMRQIERLQRDLREQAIRDPLTGLLNRRELPERLEAALQAARTDEQPLAVVMVDLDHFKVINDNLGHGGGDRALSAAAQTLRVALPPQALIFRYGGDEFCVVLPAVDRSHLLMRLEAYLDALRRVELSETSEAHAPLTASVGLAYFPDDANDVPGLLDAADIALYRAKRAGRDRIA